jgi:hypothetical protein
MPIQMASAGSMPLIRWVKFGRNRPAEPFFQQTVVKLRNHDPPASELDTSVDALFDISESLRDSAPAGLIFHMSRCGSTLLGNLCRLDRRAVVISEAQPITAALTADASVADSSVSAVDAEQFRLKAMRALVRKYASWSGRENAVIIKFTTSDIIAAGLVRQLWPDVPALFLTRDPVEVAVSLLRNPPPDWRDGRLTGAARRLICPDGGVLRSEGSFEEDIAKVLGAICRAAATMLPKRCRVFDYHNLSERTLRTVTEFFGLRIDDTAGLRAVMATYSKDHVPVRSFRPDSDEKQAAAPKPLVDLIERWARKPYDELRKQEFLSEASPAGGVAE